MSCLLFFILLVPVFDATGYLDTPACRDTGAVHPSLVHIQFAAFDTLALPAHQLLQQIGRNLWRRRFSSVQHPTFPTSRMTR
jgi:hypothetical protein